jgi:plastocyanin
MRLWSLLFVLAGVATALALVGCEREEGYPGTQDRNGNALGDAKTVDMTDAHAFKPAEVTVRVGESVVWKNTSKDVHTVSTDPERVKGPARKDWVSVPEGAKPFHSGDVRPGDRWKMTFSVPGTYKYVCTIHEEHGMMGTVVVKPLE